MDYLLRNYTVIWFDYRGHHRSDFPPKAEDLTINNIARDIECLLNELKLDKVSLLGHSMGVNLALEFYKRAPQRVDAMVLANGSARGPLSTMFRTNLMQLVFPYAYRTYEKYPNLTNLLWAPQGKSKIAPWIIGQLGFNPNLTKESDIKTYVKMISQMDPVVTLQLLKDYESYDATSWIHKIKVPTLVIAGEDDLIIPREAQEVMHQLIPNSKFELIRNGSHCPQMDIPELLNIMIERFLKEAVPPHSLSESKTISIELATSENHKSFHGELSKP